MRRLQAKLVEEGYSSTNIVNSFDQISITEEVILAFKYVKLIDQNTSLKRR
jgi:hypothetical protein